MSWCCVNRYVLTKTVISATENMKSFWLSNLWGQGEFGHITRQASLIHTRYDGNLEQESQ